MSQLILNQLSTAPNAASTGKVAVYVDSNGDLSLKDASGNITKIAAAGSYTLTINSNGTLDLGGNTLAASGGNPTITGGGTLALGGFTFTVPVTGTAAVLGTQQTYTVAPIYSAGLAAGTIYSTSVSMADNTINALSSWTPLTAAILMVIDASGALAALFLTQGGANAVTELLDTSGAFTTVKDSASKMNVYYDSGYKVQNKRGYTAVVRILAIGA